MVMQKLESLAVITTRSEHILEEKDKLKIFIIRFGLLNFCEAQGKGRAKGGPRKITQRSFMNGGWWMVVYLSLMLYIKFGCHHLPSFLPPKVSKSPGLS